MHILEAKEVIEEAHTILRWHLGDLHLKHTSDLTEDTKLPEVIILMEPMDGFYQTDLLLPMDRFSKTFIAPAVDRMAARVRELAKDRTIICTLDLELPRGLDWSERAWGGGLASRLLRAYDIDAGRFRARFEMAVGVDRATASSSDDLEYASLRAQAQKHLMQLL